MVSSSSFEDNASVETLVLAGITFGLAHVLSGPDHLCALAVIASSSSSSDSYDDDDDDENDQDEENCNDLNIERVDVDDDGKKRMRRETKNVKDDEESQSVVVYGDDDYVIIANTTNDTKKRFNDPKLLLAANRRKSRQRRDNFLLGVSWAFGHSFGLSLLVCVFFALKKELNINAIGDVGDKIVGFTMIAIAFAAARGARKFRTREKAEREHVRDSEADGEGEEMAHLGDEIILEIDPTARTKVVASGSKEHEEMHLRREPHVHQRSASRERRFAGGGGGGGNKEVVGVEKEERGENDEEKNVSSSGRGGIPTTTKEKDEEKKDSRKKSAFLVGLVHGISGVSGILGVLPGVVLNSSAKSAAFIVSFLLCSTIAMTLFSVLFGETLRKAASFAGERGKGKSDGRKLASNVIVGANAFFALGSFACGLVWLYLSFSGEGVDV